MIQCSKCGSNEGGDESKLHLHHLVPKSIGGTDADGRRYLCKKCHDILHQMLLKKLFECVDNDKKASARELVKSFSLWWIEKR